MRLLAHVVAASGDSQERLAVDLPQPDIPVLHAGRIWQVDAHQLILSNGCDTPELTAKASTLAVFRCGSAEC